MGKEDVVFLIDAKDRASHKLANVKQAAVGMGQTVGDIGGIIRKVDLNIPGLDNLQAELLGVTDLLSGVGKAAKIGLIAAAGVATYKLIDYLVDVKGAQERANETIKEAVDLYGELARAKVAVIQGFKAEIGDIKGADEQIKTMKALRDELMAQADAANQAVSESGQALTKFKQEQTLDQKLGLMDTEGPGLKALEAFLEMDKAAAKELNAELLKTTDQISAMEKAMRKAEEAKHDAYIQKIADVTSKYHSELKEQRDTINFTDREMLNYKMTLEGIDKANRDFNLSLFDQAEALKKQRDAAKEAADAERQLLDSLRQQVDVLQLGAEAAKLKEAANKGVSQEALKEAEAIQKQIAALKDKEKVEADLAAIKKRNEDEIGRLEERLKEEAERGRGPIPILVAQESRLLSRGTGKDPASSTAENTKKMKEEIEKLRAEQRLAEEAASKLMAEIAKNLKPVPDKVLT